MPLGGGYGQASCQSSIGDDTEAFAYYSGIMNCASLSAEELRSELIDRVGAAKVNAVADVYAEFKAGTKTEQEAYQAGYAVLGTVENANFSTTDEGWYCFCQMTSFTQSGSNESVTVTSAPWVLRRDVDSAAGCADN